ncbi:DNA repair protein RadC [Selenomonas sp. FC4001]|uniref:RadC family protein n=1 Tax=Selenomonas sp. FC4001 TaxID=1408313 RepID=UPI00056A6231|nr:DNA repair protein RadC [Selenomonas sp. FC4001]
MNKNLHYESNASLLSSLLDIPAENLACKKISEVLTAPLTIKGVGVKKADKLYVIKEVIRRIMEETPNDNPVIHGPEDVSKFFMPKLLHETKEHFMIAVLNTKNRIIAAPTISIGSLSASVVHPREIFKEAIKYPCAGIILVHNHPSGDPNPSKEDIAVTERLVKAGKIMDIPIIDHVIIAQQKYLSMKEKDLIK